MHGVNHFHRFGIGVRPADDEGLLVGGRGEGRFQAVDDRHAFRGVRPGEEGDDDVVALGERAADGLEGHPAHDDGVAGGLLPEVFHIAREVPQQGVLAADGVIVGDCDDEALFHG